MVCTLSEAITRETHPISPSTSSSNCRGNTSATACVAGVVCIAARDMAPGYGSRRGCVCGDDAAEAYVSQTAQRQHCFHPIPLPPHSAPPVGSSAGVDGEGSACTFGGSVRRRRHICGPPPSKLVAAAQTRSAWCARNHSTIVSGRSWTTGAPVS
ncbi:hypothetical protein B0H10DRAFT_1981424 [Mycena sp. CBHHK59/15]|nr:hypothetical protein B0H10DRAFT_1981424 [Mycena sp. CBHHK59/15]